MRTFFRSWIPITALLLVLSTSTFADNEALPQIKHPAEVKLTRELDICGAMIERLTRSFPHLEGIERIKVTRYELPRDHWRQREETIESLLKHYNDETQKMGWTSLLSDTRTRRPGAAYASPDGQWLLGIMIDPRGGAVISSLIQGPVDLDQIPELDRILPRMLGSSKPPVSSEDLGIVEQAQTLLNEKKESEAAELLETALEKNPRSVLVRRTLADVYGRMGRSDDQIAQLRSLVSIEPAGYGHRLSYARALYEQKQDYKQALFEFTQAAALSPESGAPRYFMGRIYEDMGRMDDALVAYDQAGQLAPHWLSIPLRMGSIHEKRKDWGRAERCYRRALDVNSDSEEARDGLERVRKERTTGQ